MSVMSQFQISIIFLVISYTYTHPSCGWNISKPQSRKGRETVISLLEKKDIQDWLFGTKRNLFLASDFIFARWSFIGMSARPAFARFLMPSRTLGPLNLTWHRTRESLSSLDPAWLPPWNLVSS